MSTPRNRGTQEVDSMMNDILDALDIIKAKLPNGELKVIQERIENIESSQGDMKEDLRNIRKQLLDPEDGIIVRVNKNTEFRKRKEEDARDWAKILEEHRELISWKSTVTKLLWIIVTAVVGIAVGLIFRSA
ncbi:hypothetical protein UFOVP1604_76 [uncultured Caudovirales phage]|jgi:hypothetical protein|uniref:Uncharacterized protein n=1 Tax=uncultured Caudovirales phage TaxID=2100421 RepID=A0A6J5SU49_9CAUD|nr:hypothetical protein UFOVP1604_76 [uncultured Caudovirales phage]